MKLLLEKWQKYLDEVFETSPTSIKTSDASNMFPQLDIDDIISEPTKNSSMKLALLGMFDKLEKETDKSTIRNILNAMRQFAGNSPDFTFQSKEDAFNSYTEPSKYKATRTDTRPTKSLRDWHEHIKVVNSTSALRSDRLNAFTQSGAADDSKPSNNVDPYGDSTRQKRTPGDIKSKPKNVRLTVRGKK